MYVHTAFLFLLLKKITYALSLVANTVLCRAHVVARGLKAPSTGGIDILYDKKYFYDIRSNGRGS